MVLATNTILLIYVAAAVIPAILLLIYVYRQDKADREFVKKAVREVYLVAPHNSMLAENVREQTIKRILKRIKK